MYYSAIGLLAIMILLIVNWDILHHFRVSYDKPAWNVYRLFLFAVLAYYITDTLWGFLEDQKLAKALFADTTIYFIAMAVGISFWAEYTVAYLNEHSRFGRFLVYFGRMITAVITVLTIVNIFTPVLFTVDSDSVYTALPTRYIVLTLQIIMLIIISVYALITMFHVTGTEERKTRYRIIASFGFIMAFFLIIQLWFPYLPLYSIAYMLGTTLLHSFVANDEKEDYRRGLEATKKVTELKNRITSLLDNVPGMTFT